MFETLFHINCKGSNSVDSSIISLLNKQESNHSKNAWIGRIQVTLYSHQISAFKCLWKYYSSLVHIRINDITWILKAVQTFLKYTFLNIYNGWGKRAKFNLAIKSPNRELFKVSDHGTVYGYNWLLKIGAKAREKCWHFCHTDYLMMTIQILGTPS